MRAVLYPFQRMHTRGSARWLEGLDEIPQQLIDTLNTPSEAIIVSFVDTENRYLCRQKWIRFV
jgi:hypothetical protein